MILITSAVTQGFASRDIIATRNLIRHQNRHAFVSTALTSKFAMMIELHGIAQIMQLGLTNMEIVTQTTQPQYATNA
jgi:hypothetical protein